MQSADDRAVYLLCGADLVLFFGSRGRLLFTQGGILRSAALDSVIGTESLSHFHPTHLLSHNHLDYSGHLTPLLALTGNIYSHRFQAGKKDTKRRTS